MQGEGKLNNPERLGKTDRTARLLKVEHLLYQNRQGLTVKEIAGVCGVTVRTTYRDLKALEFELGVPIWEEGTKRGIVEGYFLPPIHFSLSEAMSIFLAARLMLNYSRRYDPHIASTFLKLNSVVSSPLRDQIRRTMDWLQKQAWDGLYLRAMATLAEAWVNQRTARIWYQALGDEEMTERSIDPYFIEPAAAGHSSYVIAYCHRSNEIRTFKIERIRAVEMTYESYDIPPDFDANSYLASSWGIVVASGEAENIRLRFSPELARIMKETIWHPSQASEPQSDGSVIVTFTVTNTVELRSWILSWGDEVEVLEPEGIRQEIIDTTKAIQDVYQQNQ